MNGAIAAATIVYIAGVAAGLVCGDARPALRLVYAVLWPVGMLAFAVTLSILLAASLVAFPWFALALVIATVIFWVLW